MSIHPETHRAKFDWFQLVNKKRCEDADGFNHPVVGEITGVPWPVQNWALAIAGEAGELANAMKKVLRGDMTLDDARDALLSEVADVMTYCDLMCSALGAQTADVVWRKFDEVSQRIGWDH